LGLGKPQRNPALYRLRGCSLEEAPGMSTPTTPGFTLGGFFAEEPGPDEPVGVRFIVEGEDQRGIRYYLTVTANAPASTQLQAVIDEVVTSIDTESIPWRSGQTYPLTVVAVDVQAVFLGGYTEPTILLE
jgi:hypothetical protein